MLPTGGAAALPPVLVAEVLSTTRTGRGWWRAFPARVAVLASVIVAALGAVVVAASISPGGATVTAAAVRGPVVQVVDPGPPRCQRVVVVGDSLTVGAAPYLRVGLAEAGYEALVDGQVSRRIPGTVRDPYSGVRTARSVRSWWGEADCWVVALGANDLGNGADSPEQIDALVDEMVGAVTPGARVWWTNVNIVDNGSSFDFPAASRQFNARLDERAASDALFTVIDWYSLSMANRNWFADHAHVGATGYRARAEQTVAALG